MAAPYTLENTIRVLDSAFYNWLGLFKVNYGEIAGVERKNFPILRVFASPHRAFAQVADLLVSQGWMAGDNPALQRARANVEWPVLPLPVASIERDDPILDNSLANAAAVWRRVQVNGNGDYVSHQYPLHYLTQYRVTFWCDKRYTHAAFIEWMLAQLGLRGSGQSEILIPIEHPEPWGAQYHQLRYLGSADLSDLEGNDARHIRSMLSFTLRSWAFRTPDAPTPPVFATQEQYHINSEADDTDPSRYEAFPDDGQWGTNNLFTLDGWTPKLVETVWSTSGMAKVSLVPDEQAVHADLTQDGDAVAIFCLPTIPDQFGRSVWGIAARFVATVPFKLQVTAPQPNGSERLLAEVDVPAGTTDMHRFFPVDDVWVSASMVFKDAAGSVEVSNIDLRQLFDAPRIPYASSAVVGSDVTFVWSGLQKRPYLIVGRLDSVTSAGAGTVTVEDDSASPVGTKTTPVDTDSSSGFAVLTMPETDSLRLTVPSGFRFSVLHAQVFDGPWRGSSI